MLVESVQLKSNRFPLVHQNPSPNCVWVCLWVVVELFCLQLGQFISEIHFKQAARDKNHVYIQRRSARLSDIITAAPRF